ncbi:MAG: hypothetical protein AUF65_00220 [Chloroflexi bacterium 13_1_20CM_50_12]|nr:MAG: hypothetical protein AUF65_00220 [Chloroflexi bacterium 13_1_20CM_50_12]
MPVVSRTEVCFYVNSFFKLTLVLYSLRQPWAQPMNKIDKIYQYFLLLDSGIDFLYNGETLLGINGEVDMSISSSLRFHVLERDNFTCWCCGARSPQTELQVDHIISRAEGGTDSLNNLATLCQKCNRGKSDKHFGNYIRRIITGELPRPQGRSKLYPTIDYQLDALRQLIAQISLRKEIPFNNFVRAIQISSLRNEINSMYEPLTFATVKEGIDELIATGELAIENGKVTFPFNISSSTHEALPKHIRLLYTYAEAQGWEHVKYESQHGLGVALAGRQLGPADVEVCPQLPEVTTVLQQLAVTSSAIIMGKSGCGKTISAFQAAYAMHKQGWEVLHLVDPHRPVDELIDGISRLPRRTVLILDNAQSLDQSLIRRLLDRATESLAVIVVSTDDVVHPRDAISIANSRAVATLAKATLSRKKEMLPIIQKLDPSIGEGFFDVSLERRVEEATTCETPWQFNFVLTGGELRTKDILAYMRESNRVDLLLATIAAGQIVTLDEGVSGSWLEQAVPLLGKDKHWLEQSLRILQERRVAFGESYYRCSHLRFSVYVLRVMCADRSDIEWNHLLTMLGEIITWESTPLRGISWLLNELRFADAFVYQEKYNTIVTSSNWQQILDRCWKANSGKDRGDAAFVLDALIDWNSNHIQAITDNASLLAHWIEDADNNSSYGLGTLLNNLSQDYRHARHITETMYKCIDPYVMASKLSRVKWSEVAAWSYLIGRMRVTSSREWREQFDQAVDFTFIESLIDTMAASDVYAFNSLLKNIGGYHLEKDLNLFERAIPKLVNTLHDNVIETYREFHDSIWFVLGYAPGFLRRKMPSAAQRRVAKKLANALQPQIIAKAISYAPQRDWDVCAELLSFIKEVAPKQATKIANSINFAQLDETAQRLWEHCPRELLQLILSLSILPDHDPAKSWIMRHSDELGENNSVLAIVTPQIVVEKLRAGYNLPLTLFYPELSILALHAIAAIDNSLAVSIIEQNISKIAQDLAGFQPHNCKGVATLIVYLHNLSPTAFTTIIKEINPAEAEKNWILCLKGNTESKKAIAMIFVFSQLVEAPITEVINRLKIKYPSASTYQSAEVEQLSMID